MKKYKNLDFIIPQDGSILTIESFCISKNASNIDIIYKFLNFIFDDKNIINNFEKFSFFPPTITVFDKINVDSKIKDIISINKKDIEKFKFLEFDKLRANNIDEFFMQNLWIDIKN
jgi:spermidine/putrescine transport system substrate-binding protein